MGYVLNKEAKRVYASTPMELLVGLNQDFNLGIDLSKSFFGGFFNIHLVFNDGSEKYFYNRDDLLAFIASVVKLGGTGFENYINRFDSFLILADDIEFPEVIVEETVVEQPEPFEFTEVPEEFETEIILEENIEDETVEDITEESVEELVEDSSEETKELEEPNWKAMSGPKFSKEAIVELAKSSYSIELNIEDKKPSLLADFKEQYERLKK